VSHIFRQQGPLQVASVRAYKTLIATANPTINTSTIAPSVATAVCRATNFRA